MGDHIEALRQLIAERDSLNSRNLPDGPWQAKHAQDSMTYVPRCAAFILEHGDAVLEALKATHPQPVTPAGGEVEDEARRLFELNSQGWRNATPWLELNDQTRELWQAFALRRLTHPPVADAALLSVMESECWGVRCDSYPTGGGDSEVEWTVISYHMQAPNERTEAKGSTPNEALTKALAALNQRGGGE